jgi:glycosyltransferase involved in cell wall biosynthesis
MNNQSNPEISVVILCYKSGEFARVFYKRVVDTLTQNDLDYEIVLVGNYRPGSGDTTPGVLEEIVKSNPRTKLVIKEKLDPKHAMGWDMRSGLEATTGKTITVIDGDGQMPPEDIPKLYKTMKEHGLDLCKAVRKSRGDGMYRKFISRTFNLAMRIIFWGIEGDINGKPKIFTRAVYEKLNLESNDWFIDAEIMIKVRRMNIKIGDIKTDFHKNPERQSFISFKANFEFIKNIIFWRIKEWKQ